MTTLPAIPLTPSRSPPTATRHATPRSKTRSSLPPGRRTPQSTPRAPLAPRRTVVSASPAPIALVKSPSSDPDGFVARHAVEFAHLHQHGDDVKAARLAQEEAALAEARRVGREKKRLSLGPGMTRSWSAEVSSGRPDRQAPIGELARDVAHEDMPHNPKRASTFRPLSLVGRGSPMLDPASTLAELGSDHDAAEVLRSRPTTLSSMATDELAGCAGARPRSSVRFSRQSDVSMWRAHLSHSHPAYHSPARHPDDAHARQGSRASHATQQSHRSVLSTFSWQTDFSGEPSDLRRAAQYALPLNAEADEANASRLTTPEKRAARRRQVKAMAQTVRVLEGTTSRAVRELDDAERARILRGYRSHYAIDDEAALAAPPPALLPAVELSPSLSEVQTPETPAVASFERASASAEATPRKDGRPAYPGLARSSRVRDSMASHASSAASSELLIMGSRLMADRPWLRGSITASGDTGGSRASGPAWARPPSPPSSSRGGARWARPSPGAESAPFEYDDVSVTVSAWYRSDVAGDDASGAESEDESAMSDDAGGGRGGRALPASGASGASAPASTLHGLGFGRGEDGAGVRPSPTSRASRRSRAVGGLPGLDPRAAEQQRSDPETATALQSMDPAVIEIDLGQPMLPPLVVARPVPASPPRPWPVAGPLKTRAASASPSSRHSRRATSSSPSRSRWQTRGPPLVVAAAAAAATSDAPAPRAADAALACSGSLATCSAPSTAPADPTAPAAHRRTATTPLATNAPRPWSPTLSLRHSASGRSSSPGSSPVASELALGEPAMSASGAAATSANPHAYPPASPALPSPTLHAAHPLLSRPSVVPLNKLVPAPPKRRARLHPADVDDADGADGTVARRDRGCMTLAVSPATFFALGFACPLLWAVGAWPRRHEAWTWAHRDPWITRCRYAAAATYGLVIPGLVVGVVVVATHK